MSPLDNFHKIARKRYNYSICTFVSRT